MRHGRQSVPAVQEFYQNGPDYRPSGPEYRSPHLQGGRHSVPPEDFPRGHTGPPRQKPSKPLPPATAPKPKTPVHFMHDTSSSSLVQEPVKRNATVYNTHPESYNASQPDRFPGSPSNSQPQQFVAHHSQYPAHYNHHSPTSQQSTYPNQLASRNNQPLFHHNQYQETVHYNQQSVRPNLHSPHYPNQYVAHPNQSPNSHPSHQYHNQPSYQPQPQFAAQPDPSPNAEHQFNPHPRRSSAVSPPHKPFLEVGLPGPISNEGAAGRQARSQTLPARIRYSDGHSPRYASAEPEESPRTSKSGLQEACSPVPPSPRGSVSSSSGYPPLLDGYNQPALGKEHKQPQPRGRQVQSQGRQPLQGDNGSGSLGTKLIER